MAASVATIQPTILKLGAEAIERGEADLEDVFVTDLDKDLTPTSVKELALEGLGVSDQAPTATTTMSTSDAAASVSAEWRKMHPVQVMQDSGAQENSGSVVTIQPRMLSEADVFLQPSQVEEMLNQNSLLLNGGKNKVVSPYQSPAQRQTSCSSASTTASSVQVDDQTKVRFPLSPPVVERRSSFWNGFVSCLRLSPVIGLLRKDTQPVEKKDTWEIPFADICELNFIGSGSQGAVFVGKYLGENVAVKKVKDVNYCQEAKYLRKLSHPNIVKFR